MTADFPPLDRTLKTERTLNTELTESVDEQSPKDGPAAPAEPVVSALQDALGRGPESLRGSHTDVRCAGSPHQSVRQA